MRAVESVDLFVRDGLQMLESCTSVVVHAEPYDDNRTVPAWPAPRCCRVQGGGVARERDLRELGEVGNVQKRVRRGRAIRRAE